MKKLLIIPAFLVATTGMAFAGMGGHPSSGPSITVSHNKVIIKDSFNTASANGNTTTVKANTNTFWGSNNGAVVYVNTVTQTIQ
jgi:uncharacterized glyoxalase superfamily protein PhnB